MQDVEPLLVDLRLRARAARLTDSTEIFSEDYMTVVVDMLQQTLRSCNLSCTTRKVEAWLAAESGLDTCKGAQQVARSDEVECQARLIVCGMPTL